MDNRRSDERYPVSIAAELYTAEGAVHATIQNISAGGLGLVISTPAEPGSLVSLSLTMLEDDIEDPETPPLPLSGQVAWCEPHMSSAGFVAGVRFAPLTPDKQEALHDLLMRMNS